MSGCQLRGVAIALLPLDRTDELEGFRQRCGLAFGHVDWTGRGCRLLSTTPSLPTAEANCVGRAMLVRC